MLLSMRAQTEAMRALAYYAAGASTARATIPTPRRGARSARVDLLIPVVKAWCTDLGVEIASIGMQVHGGMGFIEETGAAQHLRDARIAPIYEGTNGIQANDLVGRKLVRDRGAGGARADRRDARLSRRARRAERRRHRRCAARLAAGLDALARASESDGRARADPARALGRRGALSQADGHRRRRLADGEGALAAQRY